MPSETAAAAFFDNLNIPHSWTCIGRSPDGVHCPHPIDDAFWDFALEGLMWIFHGIVTDESNIRSPAHRLFLAGAACSMLCDAHLDQVGRVIEHWMREPSHVSDVQISTSLSVTEFPYRHITFSRHRFLYLFRHPFEVDRSLFSVPSTGHQLLPSSVEVPEWWPPEPAFTSSWLPFSNTMSLFRNNRLLRPSHAAYLCPITILREPFTPLQ